MTSFSGTGFVRLGECDKINEPEFMTALLERAVLKVKKSQVVLEAYLTDDCPCAYERNARKIFESMANSDFINEQLFALQSGKSDSVELCRVDSGLRWVSGGVMSIDRNDVTALVHKDLAAPTHPGYFTIPDGFASGKNEILNPKRAIFREGIEEIVYMQGGEILAPDAKGESLSSEEIIADALSKYFGKKCSYHMRKVNASLRNNLPTQAVVYFNNEKVSETSCILVIDPQTAGIDLIKIMYIDADFKETIPFDTEVYKSKSGVYVPINREICLVDVPSLINGSVVSAECFKERKNLGASEKEIKPAPVLKEVIDYLKY